MNERVSVVTVTASALAQSHSEFEPRPVYPHIECPDDDSEHPFGQAGSDRDDP